MQSRFRPGTAVRLASHVRAAYYPGIDHDTMLVVVVATPDRRYKVATIDGRTYNAMSEDMIAVLAS